MATETLARMTYWSGWVCAAVALLYRLLVTLELGLVLYERWGLQPRHFWQMSFLLFLICIASLQMARAKTA